MSSSLLANRILICSSSQSHQPKELPFIANYLISSSTFSPIRALKCSASTNLAATTQHQQSKELPFIAQYLITFFGFSPDRALKYSARRNLTAIKTSERPDSVVTFLKDIGLSYDQVKAVVSFFPLLLGSNVENTLKPKVHELMDAGFSREVLVRLIRYSPHALLSKNTLSRLLFWRNFVGNNDEVLLKILQKNGLLIGYDIDDHVVPRINLLNEFGLSNRDIVSLMSRNYNCLGKSLHSLRQTLELIEELGISRESRMFVCGLRAIGGYSKDKIKSKVQFFMVTYGWSEEEVHAAFTKFPTLLVFSEKKVKSNMDFLIKKAGFELRDIALQPVLLGRSVERVLIPRYTVVSALQAKGLKKNCSLLVAFYLSESNFLEKYVAPYEEDVPGIGEAYAAAFGGKVPV